MILRRIETWTGRVQIPVTKDISTGMNWSEYLWDPGLKELVMELAGECSISETARLSNLFLNRTEDETFKARTIEDVVQQEGKAISQVYLDMKDEILPEYGFNSETGLPIDKEAIAAELKGAVFTEEEQKEMTERITAACEELNGKSKKEELRINMSDVVDQIETVPEKAVVICIDEVGVNHQKETRESKPEEGEQEEQKKKYVETAVVYIRSAEGTYRLTSSTIKGALIMTLAFLLVNSLLCSRYLLFFTDGARNLKTGIEEIFGFRQYVINLDWFHVRKSCYESFTMGLKGGKENLQRNEKIRQEFDNYLWHGKFEEAKKYLDSIDSSMIKNPQKIEGIKAYLDRKSENLYCFALRKELGLINSSNQGEKSNDLVVAGRQKHNGMSWTNKGSANMGKIRLLITNRESSSWYETRRLGFRMVPLTEATQKQYQA